MILIFGICIPVYMVYMIGNISNVKVFTVFSSFLFCVIPLIFFAREEKFKAAGVYCSLPLTRKKIILSKYLTSWFFILTGLVFTSLLVFVIPSSTVRTADFFKLDILFLFLFLATLFISVLLPFIIRFGVIGFMIFLVAAQVLGVILLLVGSYFRSIINPGAIIGGIKSVLNYLSTHLGMSFYYLFLALVIVILSYISFKCSEFFFRRKDLVL